MDFGFEVLTEVAMKISLFLGTAPASPVKDFHQTTQRCAQEDRTTSMWMKCEKRLQRTISLSEREEITGGWTKLHNVELHSSYSSSFLLGLSN
jgi:hypothetical protein